MFDTTEVKGGHADLLLALDTLAAAGKQVYVTTNTQNGFWIIFHDA